MQRYLDNIIPKIEKWQEKLIYYKICYYNSSFCELITSERNKIINWLINHNEETNISKIEFQKNINGLNDYTIVLYGKN